MSTFWDSFSSFLAAYGPWICTALVPTIITGLSVSPKTQAEASKLEAIWNFVKGLIENLSVVTHKDQPGTFKLPLGLNKLVAGNVKQVNKPAEMPKATLVSKKSLKNSAKKAGKVSILLGVLFFGSYVANSGCSWLKQEGTKAKQIVIDCGKKAVADTASQLLPTVESVLVNSAANWQDQLDALITKFGDDVVACALDDAKNEAVGYMGSTESVKVHDVMVGVVNRVETVVKAKTWVYTR